MIKQAVRMASAAWLCMALTVLAADYEPPRTAWGTPDLQGIWSNETLTPFERPAALADRAFVTEQEAKAAAAGKQAALERDASANTGEIAPPPKGGNVGGYNLGWLDNGTTMVSTRRSSLVVDPPDGRAPIRQAAITERDEAEARSYDDYEFMSLWDRCITRGMPGSMFPAGYNNYYRIIQRPQEILIYYEMIHEARIIPMDDRPRLGVASWNGQPRGRWEGDTLVVETSGFVAGGWIANSFSQGRVKGIQHTGDLHIMERFQRISETTILWQVTITDPEKYDTPWTVEIPMVARPGKKIFEYACHEGNQAVGNILRGARAESG